MQKITQMNTNQFAQLLSSFALDNKSYEMTDGHYQDRSPPLRSGQTKKRNTPTTITPSKLQKKKVVCARDPRIPARVL